MMKKIRLILMTICVFILVTGCNSSKGTTSSEEITSVEADSGNALADSIQTILDDKEYYPDITSIEVTSDYTLFTITLKSDVMNTYESMLVMSFYTAGNEQQIAAGISPEDAKTTVRYINGSTNEIISETDSSTMITE